MTQNEQQMGKNSFGNTLNPFQSSKKEIRCVVTQGFRASTG